MWRIEEHQTIVSFACKKHAGKLHAGCKDVLHQETRTVGHSEERCRWKSDSNIAAGEISIQFEASINLVTDPLCDFKPIMV
jgi:hypothetical protein